MGPAGICGEGVETGGKSDLQAKGARAYRTGPERLAYAEIEAEKLLAAGLLAAGIGKGELRDLPANEPRRVMLAAALWKKTTVRQAWIAGKLEMRNPANVSPAIHRVDWKRLIKKRPPT